VGDFGSFYNTEQIVGYENRKFPPARDGNDIPFMDEQVGKEQALFGAEHGVFSSVWVTQETLGSGPMTKLGIRALAHAVGNNIKGVTFFNEEQLSKRLNVELEDHQEEGSSAKDTTGRAIRVPCVLHGKKNCDVVQCLLKARKVSIYMLKVRSLSRYLGESW